MRIQKIFLTVQFFILWNIARLVRTALIITLNPGSVNTISDALLAASVASATAIPISAFFKAGASFTPSPVIPQMCFFSCSLFTISYLCSEQTSSKKQVSKNKHSEIGLFHYLLIHYLSTLSINSSFFRFIQIHGILKKGKDSKRTWKDSSKSISLLNEFVDRKRRDRFIFILA